MKNYHMGFLKTLHNPNTERYAAYYSIVLITVIGTIIVQTFGLIHLSSIEGGALFFEGFVSLVMLSRHSKTQEHFPHYMSKLKSITRLSLPNL